LSFPKKKVKENRVIMNLDDYTSPQKEAVEGRGQNLLVHAGAGSGKTKVLVGRFYDLVARDRWGPHQILTITFTEKAAQEMKERLRRLFLKNHQPELARQVSHAYISTIHAFCSRLLRENALEAKIDPAFSVLEEYEAYRVQKDCLRRVLNQRALSSNKAFLDFLLEAAAFDLEGDLLKLYSQARSKGLTEFSFAALSPAVEKHQAVVGQILKALDRDYGTYKEQQSWLDFADLELKAKGLLEQHRDLREELKAQWPHILLDELQDTNSLQLDIINLLRTPGQFFAVGDPHQSIYGFRFADLKAYEDLQGEVSRKGKMVTLKTNFRSRPPLLQLVDYCFTSLWPPGTTFPHIPMEAGSTFAPKGIPSVEAFIFTGEKKETGRNFEADSVCRRIRQLLKEEKLPIYDKEKKINRPLEFGDCAVLIRKTTHIKTWERALDRYGIPYQVVRSRGFFGTPEVTDLLNFLKVLENPLDDLALAGFLRSPLVGVSEDTLWLLSPGSKNNGGLSLYSALQKQLALADSLEEEKLNFARELLESLRPLRPFGFYRLLKAAVERAHYPAKSYLYPQGERIRANLHKLLQVAHDLAGVGMEHLRDLLEVADFLRYQRDEIAEGEVAAPQEGRLCLSTIHGAKGLEFPLVAVAELDSHLQFREANFTLSGSNLLAIKIKDPAGGESITPAPSLKEENKRAQQDEELRLLYVALTRAQEHLLLSGALKFNQDGRLHAGQWISLVEKQVPLMVPLKEAGEAGEKTATLGGVPIKLNWQDLRGETADPEKACPAPLAEDKVIIPEESSEVKVQAQALLQQVARAQTYGDGSHYIVSVSEVVDFYRCPRLYQLKYLWGLKGEVWEEGLQGQWQDGSAGVGETSGRDLGTFVHQLLARPEISKALEVGAIHELPLQIPDALKGEEFRIRSMLDNFMKSPWKQAMEKARRVERELPFVVKVGAQRAVPLLRGQVDALIFNDSTDYILLDYKTGKTAEEEKGYQLQLQLYTLALAKIYGIKPQKTILYYLKEGVSQEVCREMKSLEAAEHGVEKLFGAQKRQEFPFNAEYCPLCRLQKLCKQISRLNH
jgi:ATP-dependent helicase/nuclease subunit A